MTFQSAAYLLFFTLTVAASWGTASRPRIRQALLLVASYYFYGTWDLRFLGVLIAISATNYAAMILIQQGHRRFGLGVGLVGSLSTLAYFKYATFFVESANDLLASLGLESFGSLGRVLLPIGLSFFTFQALSAVVDLYRGRLDRAPDLLSYALFVGFFPTVLAGPITRAWQLIPQLQRELDRRNASLAISEGAALVLRGLIKKLAIADILSVQIVDPAFASPDAFSPQFLLLALIAYTFQVYADLSGYTDIARGSARALGLTLPENFNRPYLATSVSNFWQRWHISMSSFFRDYVFISLGGSRAGNVYVNTLATFMLIGAWHGAGWNFIVYGLLHGSAVALERARRNARRAKGVPDNEDARGWRFAARLLGVLSFVVAARVLFRAEDLAAAGGYIAAMTTGGGTITPLPVGGILALAFAAALHFTPVRWSSESVRVFASLPWFAQTVSTVALLYALTAITQQDAGFVYFQF
jgi:alginate O-acetyltransferase complex protein AlgI